MLSKKIFILIFIGIIQFKIDATIWSPKTQPRRQASLLKNNELEKKTSTICRLNTSLPTNALSNSNLDFSNNNLTPQSSEISDILDEIDSPHEEIEGPFPDHKQQQDPSSIPAEIGSDPEYEDDFEEEEEEEEEEEKEEKEEKEEEEEKEEKEEEEEEEEEDITPRSAFCEMIKKLSSVKYKIQSTLNTLNRLQRCHPDYKENESFSDSQNSSDESGLYNENKDDGKIQGIRHQAIFEESLKKRIKIKIDLYSKKIAQLKNKESLINSQLTNMRAELEKEAKEEKEKAKNLLKHTAIAIISAFLLAKLSYQDFKKHLTTKECFTKKEYFKAYISFITQKIKTDKDKRYLALLFGTILAEALLLYKTL